MSKYTDFKNYYKSILGRNIYSQTLRQYVYAQYKGKYYSDCSSSICATLQKCGIDIPLLNTAGMHDSNLAKKVPVEIENGHITNPEILKVGDCLMFRGDDYSRPLQIGHVESVYQIDGDTETAITICGHGSNTPSLKNMYQYLESREKQKAKNGLTKGLVEVLRFLPENDEIVTIMKHGEVIYPESMVIDGKITLIETTGLKCTASALNVRQEPDYSKTNKWFNLGSGYCSVNYFEGWVLDKGIDKWRYIREGYKPLVKCVETINGADYAFDRNGYMVEAIAPDGHIL